MSKKELKLPQELSADFITSAIHSAVGAPVEIEMQLIPFALHEIPLSDEFNISVNHDKFEIGEWGVVAFTKPRTLEKVYAAEFEKPDTGDLKPAFSVFTPDISFDEGLPVILNANLLDGVAVHRSPQGEHSAAPYKFRAAKQEGQCLYMAQPAYLPRSIVHTADGRVFMSSDKPEDLIQKLDESLAKRLHRHIDGSLEL